MADKKSRKVLDEGIRTRFMAIVKECLETAGEEVLITGSNKFAVPTLDEDGNEKFLELTFKIPTGERNGDAYDGYEEAEAYKDHLDDKAAKAAETAKKKAEKIARDKAEREAKAKAKKEKA